MRQKAILGLVIVLLGLQAQDIKPTCNRCSATYVGADEFQAY